MYVLFLSSHVTMHEKPSKTTLPSMGGNHGLAGVGGSLHYPGGTTILIYAWGLSQATNN